MVHSLLPTWMRYGLVSFSNDISNFTGYLIPKPYLLNYNRGIV